MVHVSFKGKYEEIARRICFRFVIALFRFIFLCETPNRARWKAIGFGVVGNSCSLQKTGAHCQTLSKDPRLELPKRAETELWGNEPASSRYCSKQRPSDLKVLQIFYFRLVWSPL
jgi:hypothetical protein